MELTKEELQHPLFKKIEAYVQSRIDVCRKINDNQMPEGETYMLRGEIKAYKSILRLNKESKD